MSDPFEGIRFQPYWWDAAPRAAAATDALPVSTDVLIVGSGFTGTNAALTLSRAGREVVVIDAAEIGHGASTRNGGQIGPGNQKFTVDQLIAMFGREKALGLYQEGNDMLAYFKELIHLEDIDCDLSICGRFRGAMTTRHYDDIARELDKAKQFAGVQGHVVPRTEVHGEIASDLYAGGVVLREDGSVHPARFHQGLVDRAQAAGTRFFAHAKVKAYAPTADGFEVQTNRGIMRSRELLFATNGYGSKLKGFFKKKIVPVVSGIIATETLPAERVRNLLPRARVYGETRRIFNYFRASPDGRRIVWGGRGFNIRQNHLPTYRRLYDMMVATLPDLQGVRITHGWSGRVGVSKDFFPHIGRHQGVYYAMGYSGTGVTRSTYFGNKVALKMLGDRRGYTRFEDLPFEDFGLLPRLPFATHVHIQWMLLRDSLER